MTNDNGAVAQLRLSAQRELRLARDSVGRWTDAIRRTAAERVGEDSVRAALSDPAYFAAIDVYRRLNDAIHEFATRAPGIEAGAEPGDGPGDGPGGVGGGAR